MIFIIILQQSNQTIKSMKKIICMLALVVCTTFAFSQSPNEGILNGGSRDTHNFECMSNPVFSQVPVEFNDAWFCDAGYTYKKVSDNYIASQPFSTMRFWGERDVKATETFLIEFFDDQPGLATADIIHSFNVTTYPIKTSIYQPSWGQWIYQIDVDFGTTITLLSGWVSVSRTTLPYVDHFGWLTYDSPSPETIVQFNGTNWSVINSQAFFCFGVGEGYHDFECLANSCFSQLPTTYDVAGYCDVKYIYSKNADNYNTYRPFSTMRFWGIDDFDDMQASETFLIEFYDGTPGDAGVNIFKTFNVTVTPVATPYTLFGWTIYQFDVDFGENITKVNGWVSISRTTPGTTGDFAWLGLNDAGNCLSYYAPLSQWEYNGNDNFFCLGGGIFNFECMEDAVFSQVPDVYTDAYFCDADYDFSKVADNYTASAPFSTMRFWAGSFWTYGLQANETFLIEFYNGQPGQPGTSVVQAFNVTASCIQVPYTLVNTDLYQIDVDFPVPVMQTVGWVSISRTTPSNTGIFGWLTFEDASGDFLQYYSPASGTWYTRAGYQFFCLGPVTPVTPLSNWALYLGIGLILAFTVIRLRKIF
jgi:hypothetical protein